MGKKSKMRWSRTDVQEDFDPNVLELAHLRPLAGKGFYSVLRNLIFLRAPEPLKLDDRTWRQLDIIMPRVPRKLFHELLDELFAVGLFDGEYFKETGEITSRRVEVEISQRFNDMERAGRRYGKGTGE